MVNGKPTLLDMKLGDVNGDGMLDTVYLYGQFEGPPGIYAENITLVIHDGRSTKSTTVHLKNNAGYNARLFLGDFNKDGVLDVMVSMDTGGSGGYRIFYIYTFRNDRLQELFNSDHYDEKYEFEAHYEDYYKVRVESSSLNVSFIIDIGDKGFDYLSQFYNDNGILKNPVQGGVLGIGALNPINTTNTNNYFDLLAWQRIIGPTNSDTLGYVENLLTWQDVEFISSRLTVSVYGVNMVPSLNASQKQF